MQEILYIGIAQSFFAGLMIALKKPKMIANQVLAAWFFLICIDMIIVLIDTSLLELYSLKVLPFTYGPLMYLYARLMTSERQYFRISYLWHFLPFIVFLILSIIFLNKPVMDGTKGFLIKDSFISLRFIYGISFYISITTYSIATFVIINQHQRRLKSFVSYSSARITLQWLLGLSITFYLSYFLVFVLGLIDILMNFMQFDPYELSFIGLTIFAFLYAFYGFNQPAIFSQNDFQKEETIKESAEGKQYVRSGLKKSDVEVFKKKILNHLETEKPYLNRELTISDLSNTLNIPRHFITEVINKELGKNFYLLINEYRVEEVKLRLKSKQYKNLTILAIAYDSGFNSKSSFNQIFKDMTGMTPSEYIRVISEPSE